ncbi:MAG: ferrous iron transporter B [Methanospirillum sp.]|nr:ferrous iron transporter B [Methanospirillum sp.]
MKKIVLMGNPNVGKSVVFSRLTGATVITSNYPGTTVDFSRGRMCLGKDRHEIVDAPGTYSLDPSNRAEEVALEMFQEADLVIVVVDATNLERNLFLALQILEADRPVVVALNMWDEAQHSGILIDVERLERELQVPVIPTVALSGEGIRELVRRLDEALTPRRPGRLTDDARWVRIGEIVRNVQQVTHRHRTLSDTLSEASIRPLTGFPIAVLVMIGALWLVTGIGELLIALVFDPLFELYTPVAMALSSWLGPGILHEVLIGTLIDGRIDYVQSMGLLTTGLYVPFAMVLPYIITFYAVLAVFEDSGYLPRLATLFDTIFHRFGLHGFGVIPIFLGLGCNVPGVLAARSLETGKQRFIATTLLAISVPCMAKNAMVFGILGPYGPRYILMVFGALAVVFVAAGLVLNRLLPGDSPEICLEIPPYRRPDPMTVLKKVWMRVGGFVREAIPFLFLGILVVNLLHALGVLGMLGLLFAPVVQAWLGLPGETTAALVIGFLRKDLAVGMLLPLGLTPEQLVIATTLLTVYFPCVGTFAVMFKELGARGLVKATAFMACTAVLVGGLMRIALLGL